MALTPTTSIPLGFQAPDFELPDVVSSKQTSFQNVQGEKGTVGMCICNHCPFVVHVREQLVKLANDFQDKGIGFVAISSNNIVTHPQDGPEYMKELAVSENFPFPYLYDETQEVARLYDAACTPDFSVFDAEQKCVYRGQLDSSRPGNGVPVDGKDMRKVLDLLVNGEEVPSEGQIPSVGCNIKWK
ncbi:MAG: thioredoxin family protein [Flavobacteriales bacterium]|nr:thioredoxin family protein [Flavobacteriales bacterium]